MACSVQHIDDEVEALVQKLIDEDMVHQKAILDLALQFDNACTAKDDLRKAYEIYKEALTETLEEEARDEKEREKKIRQKQADDEEFMLKFGVKYDSEYEYIVQQANLLKIRDILLGWDGGVMSTQEYMKKVVEDVGEDEDFKSGSWVSATDYVHATGGIVSGCLGDIKNFLKNGKLEQVVAIIKSYTSNALRDLTGTISGAIHQKVINEEGYGKDIIVGSDLILANVLVFSPKPSMHYLNITMKNVVKVFHKDSVPGNGSGVGESGMLMEEEEMANLELQVFWNVTHQEMADEEALNVALEEQARQARADQEWLDKCRKEAELDEEHERKLLGLYGTI
ncbi:hypothetical protein Tco_0343254 [Tanacetum coccineum]